MSGIRTWDARMMGSPETNYEPRDSNLRSPCGGRVFYHWTTDADKDVFHLNSIYGGKFVVGGKIWEKMFRNKNDTTKDMQKEDPRRCTVIRERVGGRSHIWPLLSGAGVSHMTSITDWEVAIDIRWTRLWSGNGCFWIILAIIARIFWGQFWWEFRERSESFTPLC